METADVMLVLLIATMLIAPILRLSVPPTPREANNAGEKPDTEGQTVVAIDSRITLTDWRRTSAG